VNAYVRFTGTQFLIIDKNHFDWTNVRVETTAHISQDPPLHETVAPCIFTLNEAVRQAAWTRMANAGAQLLNWFAVVCELHRDWRNDIEGLGNLLANHIPAYRNLMTSYMARQ
jgi:hypothetical protein